MLLVVAAQLAVPVDVGAGPRIERRHGRRSVVRERLGRGAAWLGRACAPTCSTAAGKRSPVGASAGSHRTAALDIAVQRSDSAANPRFLIQARSGTSASVGSQRPSGVAAAPIARPPMCHGRRDRSAPLSQWLRRSGVTGRRHTMRVTPHLAKGTPVHPRLRLLGALAAAVSLVGAAPPAAQAGTYSVTVDTSADIAGWQFFHDPGFSGCSIKSHPGPCADGDVPSPTPLRIFGLRRRRPPGERLLGVAGAADDDDRPRFAHGVRPGSRPPTRTRS